jgi:isocitrate dehydrogenase
MANIDIVPCDISVAGRVLAAFPEFLKEDQRVPDNLSYLGDMCHTPECNIVKLPNISAPLNQLQQCISELRAKGYDVPIYPTEPKNDDERQIAARYQKLLGSAVNPVLREGNSDRRVAPPVKAYAQKNPHRLGLWSKASKTHVAHMTSGDFYQNEKSHVVGNQPTSVCIVLETNNGDEIVLKDETPLQAGEVIDASFLSIKALVDYYEQEMEDAKESELMLSLHLKATMMKVSDPIMFGHAIRVFFDRAFEKHGSTLQEIGANPNGGLTSVMDTVSRKLPADQAVAIKADFEACYEHRPWLAMVNSDKGITNLHAPNDIIIDASMPVVVRDSGKMWNKLNELEDTKCLIPDRCYATMYQEVLTYVKVNGQFDVATMGSVVSF